MKKIFAIVKASAKENKVEQIDAAHFKVTVKAPPAEGRANEAVIEVLADYLGIPKRSLRLVSGHKSKHKIFGIE